MVTTAILAVSLNRCRPEIKGWPASLGVFQGINLPTHNTVASQSVSWCVRAWLLLNTPSLHRDLLASSLSHSLSAASQAAAQWKQLH